tara:strand:- start:386 stop:547 length:162 start_codon:yes stop_codon:yes gene_type:complete
MKTTAQIKARIRELGYELMQAEIADSYCENFVSKRQEHNLLLEKLYKLEKRVF